jgi:pimeloyl-ACP methyl ester carboxylesterase
MTPTVVLVHGAFAGSSSWDGVIGRLEADGHAVIAAANPLRDVAADAAAVGDLVRTIGGPVVLVAHSYGGAVISNVPVDAGEIVGLVYVNGFAPDPDESCFSLAGRFPGGALGEDTLRSVPRSDGTTDLYLVHDRYCDLFCADVPAALAARLAATQLAGDAGGAPGRVGRAAALARAAVVVRDRHRGSHRPCGPPTVHGRARRRASRPRAVRRVARAERVAGDADVIREAAALRVPV